ncbi:MAG TPA: GNAT family N-acetyltransferase, partial [Ruminococcaceae bacterium]|nr:GNAT family N-acetyltransferase [Oscillospiraceae bacterium]
MKMQLAKWREEFAGEIAVYANNKKIGDNLRDGFPFPYTEKDALEYIRGCTEKEEKGQFCRAIILDGLPAGSIGIFAGTNIYKKSAELGYWLGEP